MTGMHTKPTTLLPHDPRWLGLVTYAPRRPTAERSPHLTVDTIGSNPSIIILSSGLLSTDPAAPCCGMPRSQRRAGGIC
jgi:hypothetical protein